MNRESIDERTFIRKTAQFLYDRDPTVTSDGLNSVRTYRAEDGPLILTLEEHHTHRWKQVEASTWVGSMRVQTDLRATWHGESIIQDGKILPGPWQKAYESLVSQHAAHQQ